MLDEQILAAFDRAAKKGPYVERATGYSYLAFLKNGYDLAAAGCA